jgi:hypothetical protein
MSNPPSAKQDAAQTHERLTHAWEIEFLPAFGQTIDADGPLVRLDEQTGVAPTHYATCHAVQAITVTPHRARPETPEAPQFAAPWADASPW